MAEILIRTTPARAKAILTYLDHECFHHHEVGLDLQMLLEDVTAALCDDAMICGTQTKRIVGQVVAFASGNDPGDER